MNNPLHSFYYLLVKKKGFFNNDIGQPGRDILTSVIRDRF